MKLAKLSPYISVAYHMAEKDLRGAAASGLKSIISNRPVADF
jgi:protein tyrosine phosphatase (PTP) superfamily phosphohydrolase (DUF442 family)